MSENRLSVLEIAVLQILISDPSKERYGLELVDNSGGILKKGSIYVTLGRMEEKGYIKSRKEKARKGARGLPRRLYKASSAGNKALRQWNDIQLYLIGIRDNQNEN